MVGAQQRRNEMTRTQYYAMQHIAENAEHVDEEFLNIRPATMRVLKRKNWIERLGKGFVWTDAGIAAIDTAA
jgi:hypothetical protein